MRQEPGAYNQGGSRQEQVVFNQGGNAESFPPPPPPPERGSRVMSSFKPNSCTTSPARTAAASPQNHQRGPPASGPTPGPGWSTINNRTPDLHLPDNRQHTAQHPHHNNIDPNLSPWKREPQQQSQQHQMQHRQNPHHQPPCLNGHVPMQTLAPHPSKEEDICSDSETTRPGTYRVDGEASNESTTPYMEVTV